MNTEQDTGEVRYLSSAKGAQAQKHWITLFTPAYQRGKTLSRLYESLQTLEIPCRGGVKIFTFEWLIVNDGSTDNTKEIVKQWCEENKLPIRYYYQKNQGKHVAANFAVQHCTSEVFTTIDSDDSLLPNALKTLYEEWIKIPDKEHFKGVTGRCIDPNTRKILGTPLPCSPFDVSSTDMRLKFHIKGEMWGFNRTELMRKYPFPTFEEGMRFCPESIVWFEMAKEYKERVVDIPVREYHRDSGNAITDKSYNRAVSNYYLWRYGVNNLLKYFRYSPKDILKYIVGMSMDGFRTHRSVCTILNDCRSTGQKMAVLLFIPVGWLLSKR